MTVSVVFTRPKKLSLLTAAIRLFIWAPYSHAAVKVGDFYFEAVDSGAVKTGAFSFRLKNKIIARFDLRLTPTQLAALERVIERIKGTPYDWASVFGLAFTRAAHVLGFKQKANPLENERKALFCSELAYYLLLELGLLTPVKAPGLLDPKRLLRLLEASGLKRAV